MGLSRLASGCVLVGCPPPSWAGYLGRAVTQRNGTPRPIAAGTDATDGAAGRGGAGAGAARRVAQARAEQVVTLLPGTGGAAGGWPAVARRAAAVFERPAKGNGAGGSAVAGRIRTPACGGASAAGACGQGGALVPAETVQAEAPAERAEAPGGATAGGGGKRGRSGSDERREWSSGVGGASRRSVQPRRTHPRLRPISAGNPHTCVLTNAGSVRCACLNGFGELGDGTTVLRSTFRPRLLAGVQQIRPRRPVSCALTTAGDVAVGVQQLRDARRWNEGRPARADGDLLSASWPSPRAAFARRAPMLSGGVRCWATTSSAAAGGRHDDDRATPPLSTWRRT